ncbi:MAG: hypothetical protein JOY90_32055 [Bradyrhizobium sp.]|uniref:hypothetical protein n=1 Tax=Bradyrhizobium sp. TaxID=376 RepID=UPI001DD07B1D|nr:hypothetical protein [Bradyrhizobium sp.]MBV9565047.1 hypothetical protein [Bradyrhizobium sp.]
MLNYLKKFTLEILPSLAATVLGAYIVNHYINRPDTPPAVTVSPADTKPSADADPAHAPAPGVTAKGISERAMLENRAAEKPAEVKPADVRVIDLNTKGEKPAEAASTPAEPRRNPPASREKEKAVAKATPALAVTTPPAEAAASPDANDLARAAIERLRASGDHASHQEAAHLQDPPHASEAPRTAAVQTLRPLPPPITVGPTGESEATAANPPYTASVQPADPNRPIPPAEIPPPPRPLAHLRNEAANAVSRTKTVTEDMFTAAKSMFQAVIPGRNTDQSNAGSQQFTD